MSDINSVVNEIRELKKLVDAGVLTEKEFAARKALLLGIDAASAPAVAKTAPAAPASAAATAAPSAGEPAPEALKAAPQAEPGLSGNTASPKKKGPVLGIAAGAAVLVLAILAFTMFGGSKEAKAADRMIAQIGTVSLDSGDAIAEAEKAVEALQEKDLKELKRGDELKKARADYEKLVDDQKIAEAEAAIAAIGTVTTDSKAAIDAAGKVLNGLDTRLKGQVKNAGVYTQAVSDYEAAVQLAELEKAAAKVDEAIAAIGSPVDEGRAAAVAAARKAYAEADPAVQEKVGSLKVLEAAEESLSKLRTGKAEALIAAIGEVTKESGDALKAAQEAFDGLSKADQAKVSNQAVLKTAQESYQGLFRAEALAKLDGFTKDVDKIRGITWYYPSGWSFYSDTWAADKKSFVLPYIGRDKNDHFWMRIVYNYTGNDWVFFKKVTVAADGETFSNYFNYFDVVRDNGGGRVWEYVDENALSSEQKMLAAIGSSKEAIVRFEGDDYYRDKTIGDADKKGIRQAMEAYEALREAGFKLD